MADLARAWIVLAALTIVATAAGVFGGRLPPIVEAAAVMAVAGYKASTILRSFLGLRAAPAGWRTLFAAYLAVLCGAIFAIQLAAPLIIAPPHSPAGVHRSAP